MTAEDSKVLSALRWTTAARLLAQAVTWMITIFVIRILSDVDYGLISLAGVLIGFVTLVNELGAIPALVQMKHITDKVVRQVHGLVLLSNLVLAAAVFLVAPYYAAFFGENELILITRVLSTQLLIGALAATPTALLKRELDFKGLSMVDFAAMISAALTSLAMALAGGGVWSLVGGSLVNTVVRTSGILWLSRRTQGFHMLPLFHFGGLGALFGFGARVSAQRVLWFLQTQVDILLVSRLLSVELAGAYVVAVNLAMLPMNKAFSLINQVALPAYARIQHDVKQARWYFIRAGEMASLVFFPLLWGFSIVADDFVLACLEHKWVDSIVVLQLVSLVVPLRVLAQLATPMLEGLGHPGVALRNLVVSSILVPAGILVGILVTGGLSGVATGLVVSYLLAIPINARRTLPILRTNAMDVVGPLLPTVLSAALMYGVVAIARAFVLQDLSSPARLVASILIGATAYLLAILSLNQAIVVRAVKLIRG